MKQTNQKQDEKGLEDSTRPMANLRQSGEAKVATTSKPSIPNFPSLKGKVMCLAENSLNELQREILIRTKQPFYLVYNMKDVFANTIDKEEHNKMMKEQAEYFLLAEQGYKKEIAELKSTIADKDMYIMQLEVDEQKLKETLEEHYNIAKDINGGCISKQKRLMKKNIMKQKRIVCPICNDTKMDKRNKSGSHNERT